MSQKANPKLIGAFITASGVLLIGMILFFGSSSLLSQSTRYILFFDQSVNGLNVGSTVKFRGVPVGSVERILIRAEGQRPESNAIPVIIKVDHTRIEKDLGLQAQSFDPKSIQEWLDKGLLARLSIESFITGQLFVEFSVEPDKASNYRAQLDDPGGLVEIPTLASSLDEITADLGKLIADFGAIDLERLSQNVNGVLENLKFVLEGIDAKAITQTVTDAAQKVSQVAGSEDFKNSIVEMKKAFAAISVTAKTYDLENGPLGETIATWTHTFEETMTGIDELVVQTGELVDPDSDLTYELKSMLRELSRAAKSIRVLTDYLEQHPNALLTGRPEEEE